MDMVYITIINLRYMHNNTVKKPVSKRKYVVPVTYCNSEQKYDIINY